MPASASERPAENADRQFSLRILLALVAIVSIVLALWVQKILSLEESVILLAGLFAGRGLLAQSRDLWLWRAEIQRQSTPVRCGWWLAIVWRVVIAGLLTLSLLGTRVPGIWSWLPSSWSGYDGSESKWFFDSPSGSLITLAIHQLAWLVCLSTLSGRPRHTIPERPWTRRLVELFALALGLATVPALAGGGVLALWLAERPTQRRSDG
jgi:hypothetical protein